jgi:hypothetical protein
MRALRGLLVDDDPKNSATIKRSLSPQFKGLGVDVAWEVTDDPIEASEIIGRSAPFDFAIVDLFYFEGPREGLGTGRSLDEKQFPDGFNVIKELHRKDSRTYSLLVTSRSDLRPAFREEAMQYCQHAIDRNELRDSPVWGFPSLVRAIYDHVFFAGLVEGKKVDLDPDAHVLAMVEDIGHSVTPVSQSYGNEGILREAGARIIRNLVVRCLGTEFREEITVKIKYLPSGRSGSRVCRAEVIQPGDPTQDYILKFGFDKNALERELKANKDAQKLLSEQGIVSLKGKVETDISGYHAVIMRIAQASVPLDEWLLERASKSAAWEISTVLFGQLLRPLFEQQDRPLVDTRTWLMPSSSDIARARATLARFEPVLMDPRTGSTRSTTLEFRMLLAFLEDPNFLLTYAPSLPEQLHLVRSFGDLHCRNVLVQGDPLPRPVLIDASLYGFRHWASDSTRLIVDLFLRVRRPVVESMLWNDLEDSIHAGEQLCRHRYGDAHRDDTPVGMFIARTVLGAQEFTNAHSLGILADDWHWQWHAALAKEFLRQASHADLTPPRAALALLLAARHLRWSMALLRRASGRLVHGNHTDSGIFQPRRNDTGRRARAHYRPAGGLALGALGALRGQTAGVPVGLGQFLGCHPRLPGVRDRSLACPSRWVQGRERGHRRSLSY